MKERINKWYPIKIKAFCSKGNYEQSERQPSEWEKIIANETTDKGLTSKCIRSTYKSIPEKQTTQSKSGKKK